MLARHAPHASSLVSCPAQHRSSSTLPLLSFQSLANCLKSATLLRALCFQQLPTIKFCKPFVLITIQIAGGVPTRLNGIGVSRARELALAAARARRRQGGREREEDAGACLF